MTIDDQEPKSDDGAVLKFLRLCGLTNAGSIGNKSSYFLDTRSGDPIYPRRRDDLFRAETPSRFNHIILKDKENRHTLNNMGIIVLSLMKTRNYKIFIDDL